MVIFKQTAPQIMQPSVLYRYHILWLSGRFCNIIVVYGGVQEFLQVGGRKMSGAWYALATIAVALVIRWYIRHDTAAAAPRARYGFKATPKK